MNKDIHKRTNGFIIWRDNEYILNLLFTVRLVLANE